MSWQEHGACVGRVDIDWFPRMEWAGGQNKAWRDNLTAAREVCDSCPVKAECLAEAMSDPLTDGIWAGTTSSQRRRSGPRRRPERVARCGTETGYRRHRYRCEEPCQMCRDAHAIAARINRLIRAEVNDDEASA